MRLLTLSVLAAATAAHAAVSVPDPVDGGWPSTPLASASNQAPIGTAEQFDALQTQIEELRRELEWQRSQAPVAPMVTVSNPEPAPTPAVVSSVTPIDDVSMDLSKDIDDLMAWRESMEKEKAKAAAKAALSPSLKLHGRFFLDTYAFDQNAASVAQVGNAQNATLFRQVWILMQGDLVENTSYRMWFNATGGDIKPLDIYLDFAELPHIQNLRVGHFFEPFGMEQLTPNTMVTFMERSSAFTFFRNTGVMAHSDDELANWTYGAGVFVAEQADNPIRIQDDNDTTAFTGRISCCPWYDEATDGRGVLHFGANYSYRSYGDDTARIRNRPESFAAPFVVDTGNMASSGASFFGLEAAYAYGPFRVQSEYHAASVNQIGAGDEYFDGFYVETSYFLTGENRYYNRRSGTFANRLVPIENFFRVGTGNCNICTGLGAWEVAYRYSTTDLTSGAITGGEEDLHTVGLNWYLSPYTRVMLDYVHSSTDTVAVENGVLQAMQMRLQFDF